MMGMGRMGGPAMDGPMGINKRSMDMNRIDLRIPLGSVEIWEIRNATPLTHPFHIHDVQFRILDRAGSPPHPHEHGLKDTVLVDANSAVRIITEFSDFADPDHAYMYHCHILEHEDGRKRSCCCISRNDRLRPRVPTSRGLKMSAVQPHIPTEVYLDFLGANDPGSLGLPRHPDRIDLVRAGSDLHSRHQIWKTETHAKRHPGESIDLARCPGGGSASTNTG